jgi:hypothetical protein
MRHHGVCLRKVYLRSELDVAPTLT